MAVQWDIENKRGSVYYFDPDDVIVHGKLNGRHFLPDITELIEDIVQNGQIQPVEVRSEKTKEGVLVPVLLSGFSRWRAIKEINKRKLTPEPLFLSAVYIQCNEVEGYLRNWSENRKRNQTQPMDDAHQFAQLKKWNWDERMIAERLGVEVSFVKKRLKLIAATDEVQQAVADKRLAPTAAEKIAEVAADVQRATVKGNGKITGADINAALGKAPKVTVKAIRAFVEDELALDVEDGCAKVLRRLLELIDGGVK
jgi:ParB/RepB/Spo0J family partition protein